MAGGLIPGRLEANKMESNYWELLDKGTIPLAGSLDPERMGLTELQALKDNWIKAAEESGLIVDLIQAAILLGVDVTEELPYPYNQSSRAWELLDNGTATLIEVWTVSGHWLSRYNAFNTGYRLKVQIRLNGSYKEVANLVYRTNGPGIDKDPERRFIWGSWITRVAPLLRAASIRAEEIRTNNEHGERRELLRKLYIGVKEL